MKLWFRLTLVCGALVGLLLGLSQVVGLNYPLLVVDSGSWFDRGREPVSDAHTVPFLMRSMQFDPGPAAPLKFLVLNCALTAGNISPPGQQTYGRPDLMGLGKLPVQPATQSNTIGPLLGKITGSTDRI